VAPGVCVQELRCALGDDRKKPRFIVTVHRRGYRFIAPLSTTPSVVSSQQPVVSSPSYQPTPNFVGRETELTQLHHWLEKARCGGRQIVFVTGEPGIGKTALIEAFLRGIGSREVGVGSLRPQYPSPNSQFPTPGLWLGHGQCIEHCGAGEVYLPVLEALGRIGRGAEGARLIEVLRRYAPMWLVQLPALVEGEEIEALQRKVQGASRERMLRELGEAQPENQCRTAADSLAGRSALERRFDIRLARFPSPAEGTGAAAGDRHLSSGGDAE
jgi:hypothetical protein